MIFTALSLSLGLAYGVDTGNAKTAYVLESVAGTTDFQRMFKPGTSESQYPNGEYGLSLNCNCHTSKYTTEVLEDCHQFCVEEEGCGYFQLWAESETCWTFPADIDLSNPAYQFDVHHELDIRIYKLPEQESAAGGQVDTGNPNTAYVLEDVEGTTDYQRMFKPGTIEQQFPNGEYGLSLNCNCHSNKYDAERVDECYNFCMMEEGCGYFQFWGENEICWTFPADIDLGNPAYRFDEHHEYDIRIYKPLVEEVATFAPEVATPAPTVDPTATPTANPTATPTAKPTAIPTAKPTAIPTAKPTAIPTAQPTAIPTATPTAIPTATPTAIPTATPTAIPTAMPTPEPTNAPRCASWCAGHKSLWMAKCSWDSNACAACDVCKTNNRATRNKKLMDVAIAQNFKLDVDVTPFGTVSGWSNIVHLTSNNQDIQQGSRIPGIWFFSGTTKLHVCASCDGNKNTCLNYNHDLPIGVTSRLSVAVGSGKFTLTINGNQVLSRTCTVPWTPPAGTKAAVYVSDPWYSAANVAVTGLKYTPNRFIDVRGPKSARQDDAASVAACPAGYTVTGCSCYSPWDSCDGAYISNNKCMALNNYGGSGVYAYARCGLVEASNFQDKWGPRSARHDDAPSSVTCPAGTTLTGCECYSYYDSCDGAKPSGNTCTAYNNHGGKGVWAYARCGKIAGATGWTQVTSGRSAKHDDAETRATCPEGKSLTDCTCYSPWKSCDGAAAHGNTCFAYNNYGGHGVYATARCANI